MEITINNPYMLALGLITLMAVFAVVLYGNKNTEEPQHDLRHDSFYSISNRKNK